METFPRYWPFVRRIHRSAVNSPHKGQWRGALMFSLICTRINGMFSLICTRINGWVNNGEAGDLRRHRAHYDVTVMSMDDTSLDENMSIVKMLKLHKLCTPLLLVMHWQNWCTGHLCEQDKVPDEIIFVVALYLTCYGLICFPARHRSRRRCLWRLLLWTKFWPQSEHSNGFSPVWMVICCFKLPASANFFPHVSHSNGFSLTWVRECRASAVFPPKLASHCLHWWRGFSSLVWMRRCFVRSDIDINDFPHTVHSYGLSPVWFRICFVSTEFVVYPLPQILHLCGRSPVWHRICFVSSEIVAYPLPQILHSYGFSLIWVRWWLRRRSLVRNCFSQMVHWYGVSPLCMRICFLRLFAYPNTWPQIEQL